MATEKKVILLKADGTRQDLTPEKKPTLEEMQAWVGGYIEVVRVSFEGKKVPMVVNEEGLIHRLPINYQAGRIAGSPIVGDVFILIGWRLLRRRMDYKQLRTALEDILKNYPETHIATIVIPREVLKKSLQAVNDCLEMRLKGRD